MTYEALFKDCSISGRIQCELSVILLMDVDYREVLHCCAKIKCIAFYIELNFFSPLFSMCLYLLTNKVLVIYIMLCLCDLKFLLACGFGNLKSSFVLL